MQDDELELIRRRKMAELQSAQQAQLQQQAMMQEQAARREAEIQAIMRQILTPEARDRLATVRLAYPEVAAAVEGNSFVCSDGKGQVRSMITP